MSSVGEFRSFNPPAVTNVHGVAVQVVGNLGEQTPAVLIHGVGSDAGRWDPMVGSLAEHGPVVRYDLRGHGRSKKPAGPYTLDDFVDDFVQVTGELGITRAHLVGMSLGGLIAQAVAVRHPHLVDKLVILSAVAGRTPAQAAAVMERLRAVEAGGPGAVVDGGSRWYSEGFRKSHPEVVRQHLDRFLSNDPAAYAASFRVLATNDLVDDLHRITSPTLIMTGSLDVGSPPEMAIRMSERIPDSSVVIVDGVKHALIEEAAAAVAENVCAFLYAPGADGERSTHTPHRAHSCGSPSPPRDSQPAATPSKGEVSGN